MNKESMIKEITNLLEEEKWSKFQLSEYNLSKFMNLERVLDEVLNSGLKSDVLLLCHEYLKKNEYNLVARYLISVLSYPEETDVFNAGFKKIIGNFKEREKWGIVEFLSKKMLSFQEDEFALRTLIDSLKALNKSKEILPLQEQLLKIVPEDQHLALSLARINESSNNAPQAVKYYKMAFKMFITGKNSKSVEDIWFKILELSGEPLEIYYEVESLLHTHFSPQFTVNLLSLLIHSLTKSEQYNDVISILKKMLQMDPANKENREELIKVYRLKYKDHTKLEELLKASGLRMWWKDINSAVDLFEKQIRFDVGVYVSHYNWGCGKIIRLENELIHIDFEKNPEHKMSFDMALNTLEIIPESHIKVRKRYELDTMTAMAQEKPVQVIEIILSHTPRKELSLDQLKDEILDRLIKPEDWQRWWNRTKKELKISQNFKFIESERLIKFIETDSSYGDIILGKFDNTPAFLDRIDIINELLLNDTGKKVSLEIYQHIADFLIGFIHENCKSKPELAYISSIIVNKIKSFYPEVVLTHLAYDEDAIVKNVEDLVALFRLINIFDYQKRLVENIIRNNSDWDKILYRILFTENNKIFDFIIDLLVKNGKKEMILTLIDETLEKYRETPELFYFISKNIISGAWAHIIKTDMEIKSRIFLGLFSLLFYLGRQIRNKINPDHFSKIQKQIIRLLFDKNTNHFLSYIKQAVSDNHDTSSLLTLFKENEYIPKKTKENIIAELRNFEKPVAF